ncbi:hypothetical protein B0H19DRAFT_660686 [Mycena capillaripes]|nr:hypothetical protein B0H19DRAFT_660686 [Mycena capillaripes]
MPATRHTRREGRGGHNPLALPALPAIPSFFSSANTSTTTATSITKEKESDADVPKGYSTDTSPFFLRRSTKSRRVDDLVQRGLDSSRLLQSISSSMNLETVQLVAGSCAMLFDTVQIVRTNRTQCRQLLERVHQIVRALINLCGDAQKRSDGGPGPGVGLAPQMARAIDHFTMTLTNLHTILQEQASAGMFSRIFRHAETRGQLADCDADLQQALNVFTVKTDLLTHAALGGAKRAATERHNEILRALGRAPA